MLFLTVRKINNTSFKERKKGNSATQLSTNLIVYSRGSEVGKGMKKELVR